MVENLKQNFEKLIALYEGEKQKNSELEAKYKQSQEALESKGQQIVELKKQIDNLRLADAFTGNANGTTIAKERIDKLIKEIDKCISFLEK